MSEIRSIRSRLTWESLRSSDEYYAAWSDFRRRSDRALAAGLAAVAGAVVAGFLLPRLVGAVVLGLGAALWMWFAKRLFDWICPRCGKRYLTRGSIWSAEPVSTVFACLHGGLERWAPR